MCKAEDTDDIWFIANNISQPYAIREYKKRFDIEEMFRDFKSNGFNLEGTWSKDIHYIKILFENLLHYISRLDSQNIVLTY